MELIRHVRRILGYSMHLALFAAVAFGVGSPVSAGDRALVIGVNQYPYAGKPSDPDAGNLAGAVNDAKRFRNFLITSMGFAPDEITMLLDRDATHANVVRYMKEKLRDETGSGDRVVFFFAGHGIHARADGNREADGKDEFILFTNLGREGYKAWMMDDEIGGFFESLSDRRVMLVVDSCHSGTISRSVGGTGEEKVRTLPEALIDLNGFVPFASRAHSSTKDSDTFVAGQEHMSVWSAVAQDEVALETNRNGQSSGVFTSLFLEGLGQGRADQNRNGTVSNSELLTYLRQQSKIFCDNNRFCQEQKGRLTPDFVGNLSQDALLADVAPVAANPEPETPVLENPTPGNPTVVTPTPENLPLQNPSSPLISNQTQLPFGDPGPAPGPVFNQPGVLSDLFVPSNDAGLTLTLRPGNALRLGDIVTFDVNTNRSGHLILLDYNPEGELYQIFPSNLSRRGAGVVRAGTTFQIPEGLSVNGNPIRIRVTEPHGQGHLVAILVESALESVTNTLPDNVNLEPIPNASSYLYRLAEQLNRLQSTAAGMQANLWSATVIPYTITP